MILKLRARHFKNTKFDRTLDQSNCPIEEALGEIFKYIFISEGVTGAYIGERYYRHTAYYYELFSEDEVKAEALGYGEDIIREINIPALEEPIDTPVICSDQIIRAKTVEKPVEELAEV